MIHPRHISFALTLAVAACAAPRPAPTPAPATTPVAVPILRPPEPPRDGDFAFQGALTQGGTAIGQAPPGTTAIAIEGASIPLTPDGRFLVGFPRDAFPTATIIATLADGSRIRARPRIAPRTWRTERIDGLPARPPSTPSAEYERIRSAETAAMRAARARTSPTETHWLERFVWPATGRISGVYGSQRILSGVPRSPHYGVDIARPTGTPIVAPAGGTVVLASPPRFSLEGNLLLLDHGHGLVSAFLHLSRIDVTVGQRVAQGQRLGAIGSTGRSTGPHLHWAMTWREVRVDPQLLVGPMPTTPSPAG